MGGIDAGHLTTAFAEMLNADPHLNGELWTTGGTLRCSIAGRLQTAAGTALPATERIFRGDGFQGLGRLPPEPLAFLNACFSSRYSAPCTQLGFTVFI